MPRKEIIATNIGDRFGQLIILEKINTRIPYFICKCDCGNTKNIRRDHLKSGGTISCGCYQSAASSQRVSKMHKGNITHGMTGTRIYGIWCGIRQRCTNPNAKFFSYYGGRGIKVCDRWLDSFENFLADMGEPQAGYTLDRVNNEGNYEPNNCKWVTRKEQASNTRRNRNITYKGVTLNVTQWSKKTSIPSNTIITRLENGWTEEDALTTHIVKERREVLIQKHFIKRHKTPPL